MQEVYTIDINCTSLIYLWCEYHFPIIRHECIDVCSITNILPGIESSLLTVLHVAVPNSVRSVSFQHLPAAEMVATVEVQLEDTIAETECSQSCIYCITDNDAIIAVSST